MVSLCRRSRDSHTNLVIPVGIRRTLADARGLICRSLLRPQPGGLLVRRGGASLVEVAPSVSTVVGATLRAPNVV